MPQTSAAAAHGSGDARAQPPAAEHHGAGRGGLTAGQRDLRSIQRRPRTMSVSVSHPSPCSASPRRFTSMNRDVTGGCGTAARATRPCPCARLLPAGSCCGAHACSIQCLTVRDSCVKGSKLSSVIILSENCSLYLRMSTCTCCCTLACF